MKTDDGFVDTEDDFDWLSDSFDLEGEMKKLRDEGYVMASTNHVPNEEFFDYAFIGPLLFVKPVSLPSSPHPEVPSPASTPPQP